MLKLNFVTPERKIATDVELAEAMVPAYRGELDILPGHAPLMTTLVPGVVTYKLTNGETQKLAINWGYCEVSPEAVNILAELAVKPSEVEKFEVSKQIKNLEHKLVDTELDDAAWEKTQRDLKFNQAQEELA